MRFASASIGSLLTLVIGLAASIILNRLLGVEGRGAFALAVRTAGILGAVAQWGIPEMMMGILRAGKHPAGTVIGTGLAMVGATVLILGAFFVMAAPLLETTVLRGVPTEALVVMVISSAFTVGYGVVRRVIQLRGQLITYNLVELAKSATFLALLVPFLFYSREQLQGTVLAFLVSEAALALFCAAFVWWRLERSWTIDRSLAVELARSGVLIQVGMVAMFLAGQAGVFIVNVWGSLADVGYYATALGLATYVTFVSVSIRTVLHSRMMQTEGLGASVADLTVIIARHTLVWLIVSASVLALLGQMIIVTLYGVDFEPAYPILVWFLPGMVCLGLQQILASYFNAQSEFRLPTVGAFIAAGVGLLLQIWLTPLLGARGAAAALSMGYASALTMYVMMFRRRTGLPMSAFLPTAMDLAYYRNLVGQILGARR
ncbi:MAG: polysaccharide biosynthesis C-terminal domain-containing protein [Chloroflexota bacterium]